MNATIDQQFIEFIVKSVVSNPDEVKVERHIDEKGVLLELIVNPEDLGRVIGKRGATAQSLRTLLRALGTKNDARYNLKIIDTSDGERPAPRKDDKDDSAKSSSDDDPAAKSSDDKLASAEDIKTVKDSDEKAVSEDEEEEDKKGSDSVSKTRKELADLDDLDI